MKHEAFERIVVALDESEALRARSLAETLVGVFQSGTRAAKGALLRKSKSALKQDQTIEPR